MGPEQNGQRTQGPLVNPPLRLSRRIPGPDPRCRGGQDVAKIKIKKKLEEKREKKKDVRRILQAGVHGPGSSAGEAFPTALG